MATVFKNARIFSPVHSAPGEDDRVSSMVIKKGRIVHVGSLDKANIPRDATIIDLQNRIMMPGFIDGHAHILQFRLSRPRVDLISCTCLEGIRESIKSYTKTHPSVPRILCRGWIQSTIDGNPLASMIDDIDPRPIYIEASDLHSIWCNSAALDEMQTDATPDPPGGTIHREENGQATGLLSEGAVMNFVWPFLECVTPREEKLSALRTAIESYSAAGYTGVVDMAMSEDTWEILNLYRCSNKIPFHIAIHWLVPFSDNQQVNFSYADRAIELSRQFNGPDFCITGIKLMCDGVVDGCTAALRQPYGLQVTVHAIGDQALTSPEDAKRLVHFKAWPGLIGAHRCKRAFAYKDFLNGGARIALGTDAPTAPHYPFQNMYHATTRRSAVHRDSSETLNPEFGLELVGAVVGATEGAAYSRFAELWTGSLKEGLSADFVVVDMAWTPERLLDAKFFRLAHAMP
ncbi:amidohydrolase family-domain-containing protein [Aspergillus varians]